MEKTKKEIGRFLIAGIIVLVVDASFYYLLLFFLQPSLSKAIAFICGTTAAYLLNKFWTFKKSGYCHKEIIKFIILYLGTMSVNVGINSLFLSYSNNFPLSYVIATAITASINYLGQKFIVFKNN